jgi:hypothetical protein
MGALDDIFEFVARLVRGDGWDDLFRFIIFVRRIVLIEQRDGWGALLSILFYAGIISFFVNIFSSASTTTPGDSASRTTSASSSPKAEPFAGLLAKQTEELVRVAMNLGGEFDEERRLAAVALLTNGEALKFVAEKSTCPNTRAKAIEKILHAELPQGPAAGTNTWTAPTSSQTSPVPVDDTAWVVVSSETVQDAWAAGCEHLGVSAEDTVVEIVSEPQYGRLGKRQTDAMVRVRYRHALGERESLLLERALNPQGSYLEEMSLRALEFLSEPELLGTVSRNARSPRVREAAQSRLAGDPGPRWST